MDPAFKRIAVMAMIMIIVSIGLVILLANRYGEAEIISQIDDAAYIIDDLSGDAMNITIQFGITIENYGSVRDVTMPCSTVQSYLDVKNSTIPLIAYQGGTFGINTSYILDTTYTSTSCDNQPSTKRVGENVIDNIIVQVPFRFVSGTYSFIWIHSLADTFDAVIIEIDLEKGEDGINVILEAETEDN